MPLFDSAKDMTLVIQSQTKQKLTTREAPKDAKLDRSVKSKQDEIDAKELAAYYRYKASQDAMRDLEQRRSFALAAAHRYSFFR
jgi:hypothetical protein